jgi:hypothetical protein
MTGFASQAQNAEYLTKKIRTSLLFILFVCLDVAVGV